MPPVALSDEYSTTSSFSVIDRKPGKISRRRSVDFVLDSKVLEYDAPTEEEREEMWYNRDEYDIIKARNSLIVKMMKCGSFQESEEHTFRGLEHKLKDGFKQRRTNKFNALNAVLEEQDRQYGRGFSDPDSIAEAYRLVSLCAKEKAFVLGSCDSQESYCFLGSKLRTRKTLSDLLQDDEEEELPEDDETDLDTVCSESTTKKKNRIRSMFHAVSRKRKDQMSRRSSM